MTKTKVSFILLLNLLPVIISFGQIEFEKGHFIDLNNQRIDCLIKNHEWKNNPKEFSYKLPGSDVSKEMQVTDVKEFEIEGYAKYVSVDVKIDRSTDDLSRLYYNRNPEWSNERLFLKVLINGKASLYFYGEENLKRFFYRVTDSISQLVYKKFLAENKESKTNNTFLQQLWMDVKCGINSPDDLKRVNYNTTDLTKYFINYNACSGEKFIEYEKKKHDVFHLKITPGINYSSISVIEFYTTGSQPKMNVEFENKLDLRVGLEAEYVLPNNKNKWSLLIEPNYQKYNSTIDVNGKALSTKYNSFEIPVGIRYYMFLSPDSRLFLNAMIVAISYSGTSNIGVSPYFEFDGITPKLGTSLGLGYSFMRLSGEFRYYRNPDLLNEPLYFTAPHERLTFILGFRLF